MGSIRRGESFDVPVIKIDGVIKGFYRNAFVAAMRAIVSEFGGNAGNAVGGNPFGVGEDAIARSGRHGGNDGHTGPHFLHDFFERLHHFGLKFYRRRIVAFRYGIHYFARVGDIANFKFRIGKNLNQLTAYGFA